MALLMRAVSLFVMPHPLTLSSDIPRVPSLCLKQQHDDDAAALRARCAFPAGFRVVECASFAEPGLRALSTAFAAEDARVGVLPRDGPTGGADGAASLLLNGTHGYISFATALLLFHSV